MATEALEGRSPLVTGASRGIGAAVARRLAGAGVALGLGSRSGDDLGIEGAVAMTTDVRDPAAVEALVDGDGREHGRLDIVVANAGVGVYGPFLELDPEQLERMIDVNLKGVLYTARATLRAPDRGGGGTSSRWRRSRGLRVPGRGGLQRIEVRPGRLHALARP